MYYYALTLRKTVPVKDTDQAERAVKSYYSIITYMKQRYPHLDIRPTLETVPKLNGKHNVHLHAMIKSERKILKSMFPTSKGIHLYMESCKSEIAWNAYISKDDIGEQDVYDLIETYNNNSSDQSEE